MLLPQFEEKLDQIFEPTEWTINHYHRLSAIELPTRELIVFTIETHNNNKFRLDITFGLRNYTKKESWDQVSTQDLTSILKDTKKKLLKHCNNQTD